jgi:hypothetical protein
MQFSRSATRQVLTLSVRPEPGSEPIIGCPSRNARLRSAALYVATMLFCSVASLNAQQPVPGQDHPDAPSATRKPPSSGMISTINRKSLFFPDIATNENRLSTGDKFKLFVDNSASLSALTFSALSAGIGQAEYYPHGYRQGAEGYGKRFGASMARNASSEFFGTFMLASMLRQDPRFFPQADPTFGGSAKYAVSRVFVTRSDDGNEVANWSGLVGPLLSEGLANAYWPEGERTAPKTFQRYGVDLAWRAGFNMFRNYWPVLFKRLRGSPRH